MSATAIHEYLSLLVQRYGLRELAQGYEYMGLHRGVTIHIVEYGEKITMLFFSAQAELAGQIGNHFSGFQSWLEVGLAPAWIEPREGDSHCCVVVLDGDRLGAVGSSQALLIPDLIARDFHAHGAPPAILCCNCRKVSATTTVLIDGVYTPLCFPCFQEAHRQAERERLQKARSVAWPRVLPRLIALGMLGTTVWALLQIQMPEAPWLFLVPLAYGWLVSTTIVRSTTGTSAVFWIVLLASVFLVVLAGRLWAFRVTLAQEVARTGVGDVIGLYFTIRLPTELAVELSYFTCGLLGACFGGTLAKRQAVARIR